MIGSIIIGSVVGILITYIIITFILPRLLKNASDQLLIIAKEKLGTEKQEIKIDLENKKEAIEDLIKRVYEELDKGRDRLDKSDKDRIGSFRELKQELENQRRLTELLSTTTENLKKVLSNNQMRGQFGEQVAENLLKMSGFVRGVDYDVNREQKSTGTRPDFIIYLPNKTKINVDVKFPYQNLQRMTETEDKATKKELEKAFERDVSEKIKQISSRDYINPEENTVDFVILFIPNEMIFSYVYEKMNDLWVSAMKQKVVFAGPFSFTAILRLVHQAYDNFHYQKNVQKIIGHIKTFGEEFIKYNEEFIKIGERIESLTKQYEFVNSTRKNQLVKTVDKVRLESPQAENLLTDKL